MQVGPRGRLPPATAYALVQGCEALLLCTVDVGQHRMACLLGGGEERREDRAIGRSAGERVRTAVAPVGVVLLVEAVLQPPEVGQAVRVVPPGGTALGGPPVEVRPVTALVD